MNTEKLISFTLITGLLLAGCSDNDDKDSGTDNGDSPTAGLTRFADKEEFLSSVRDALIHHQDSSKSYEESDSADDSGGETSADANASDADSSNDGGGSADSSVTGTNVQEIGVDEADRVKWDANYLYVLNSDKSPYFSDFALESDDMEGRNFTTKSQIRMLSLDADAADATLINTLELSGDDNNADGLYLYKNGNASTLLVTSSSMSGHWGLWDSSFYFYDQKSAIHKVDVTDPASAGIVDTLEIEGQIISSRRIDNRMIIASRYFPEVSTYSDLQGDEASVSTAVNNMSDSQLLPEAKRLSDDELQDLAGDCFVAPKRNQDWYTPDIVSLFTVDIDTLTVSDSVCFLGYSETLYVSPNAAFLATTSFDYSSGGTDTNPDEEESSDDTDTDFYEPVTKTDIHQFDIDGGSLTYRGSGSVTGILGHNPSRRPFRLSEKNGFLRVITQNGFSTEVQSPVLFSVLQPADGALSVIAQLPNASNPEHIGKPGEQLYASRFLGDKAYIVTFRATDPLYVVDAADPRNPKITGELQIEGYSDYLQPVGENHLLGIGRGAIAMESEWRGALATGVKITLFDVSDATSPTEVQSIEIGKRGTNSDALFDHHGITVQQASESRPARLLLGIDVADIDPGYNDGPWTWYNWSHTGLYGFEVQTGANAGLSHHGQMVVERKSDNQLWPQRGGDRSAIVHDTVYYIHGEQVYGANWDSLPNFNGPR